MNTKEYQSIKTLANNIILGKYEGNLGNIPKKKKEYSYPLNIPARNTQKWAVKHVKKYPKLPTSICAVLDFLDKTEWTRPIPPKMCAWIDSDREVLKYEKETRRSSFYENQKQV